jgi:hypothetical protein
MNQQTIDQIRKDHSRLLDLITDEQIADSFKGTWIEASTNLRIAVQRLSSSTAHANAKLAFLRASRSATEAAKALSKLSFKINK